MIEAQVMQRAHYPRSVESVGKLSRELGCAAPKVAPNLFAFCLSNRAIFIASDKVVSRQHGKVSASWIHSN